jgi:hypothetical protein
MILQAVERVATWLANGTAGVNALLPSVPRIGADAQPANVTILDERQHPSATRGQFKRDQTFPVLLVQLAQDVEFDMRLEQAVRDAPALPIAISYAVKNQDSAVAGRSSYYTMVAVEQSLKRLFYGTGTQADRTQGAVSLVTLVGLRHVKIFAVLGDAMETTAIIASFYVRDASP